jgi:hypothetical protein
VDRFSAHALEASIDAYLLGAGFEVSGSPIAAPFQNVPYIQVADRGSSKRRNIVV